MGGFRRKSRKTAPACPSKREGAAEGVSMAKFIRHPPHTHPRPGRVLGGTAEPRLMAMCRSPRNRGQVAVVSIMSGSWDPAW